MPHYSLAGLVIMLMIGGLFVTYLIRRQEHRRIQREFELQQSLDAQGIVFDDSIPDLEQKPARSLLSLSRTGWPYFEKPSRFQGPPRTINQTIERMFENIHKQNGGP